MAYTASQYDPSYNNYLLTADDVLQKNLPTEDWLDALDKYIYMISDPIFQWKKFRNQLLENDVSLLEVAKFENVFVKSYMKGDFKNFKNLSTKLEGNVKSIFTKFVETVLIELIKML